MENEFTETLIGKTEDEARNIIFNNGYHYRVTIKDGNYYVMTRDYRVDRINLVIKDNLIIKADLG